MAEVTSLVSSVVIESDNNIVLDFSSKTPDDDEENIMPGTSRSDSSSTSLLSKVIKVTSSRNVSSILFTLISSEMQDSNFEEKEVLGQH